MSNRTLLLRSLLFTIAVPGAVVAWLPFGFILSSSTITAVAWTPAAYAALLLIGLGASVLIWCIGDFMVVGRGRLAPIDPPALLVVVFFEEPGLRRRFDGRTKNTADVLAADGPGADACGEPQAFRVAAPCVSS